MFKRHFAFIFFLNLTLDNSINMLYNIYKKGGKV
nr:MAG TPA: hypothetical protein [Caudoviricetes sp.]